MSQKIRVGNCYYHKVRDEEVLVTHHDSSNNLWFRGVISKDNAGVIGTSDWIEQQPYDEFLSCVDMKDYPDDEVWAEMRHAVLDRDDSTCQGCGAEDVALQVHHIVPLSCGGTNTFRNLISLCEECHGRIHGGPI